MIRLNYVCSVFLGALTSLKVGWSGISSHCRHPWALPLPTTVYKHVCVWDSCIHPVYFSTGDACTLFIFFRNEAPVHPLRLYVDIYGAYYFLSLFVLDRWCVFVYPGSTRLNFVKHTQLRMRDFGPYMVWCLLLAHNFWCRYPNEKCWQLSCSQRVECTCRWTSSPLRLVPFLCLLVHSEYAPQRTSAATLRTFPYAQINSQVGEFVNTNWLSIFCIIFRILFVFSVQVFHT